MYLAAFESGALSPVSLFDDTLRTYRVNDEDWSPRNFADQYLGLTTVANALVKSANATSVQIAMDIGPERIVDLARRLGIQSQIKPYPSIALGAQEVTLLDMAVAYGAIASYGFRVMPTFITRIEDATGQVHYEHRPNPRLVIDPEQAVIMVNLMQLVVNRGNGARDSRAWVPGSCRGEDRYDK